MKARLLRWLQLRTKEEQAEYKRELLRSATRNDVLQYLRFAFGLLAIVVTIQNVVVAVSDAISGTSIPWAKVGLVQAIAVLFYVAYLYLKPRNEV